MNPAERPIHVVYVVTRADSMGGAQVHVLDLSDALLARGHQVTVLVGGEGPFTEQMAQKGIPYRSLRHLTKPVNPGADLRATLEIWRALRALRPDLVAAHTAKAGMLARWAAAMASVPAVFTPHGWSISDRISQRQGRVFRQLERLGGYISAGIINVCEYERHLAARHRIAPDAKLAMVHNGIPDVRDGLLANPDREPPRLVTVARFEEPKDHRTLLSSLARLVQYEWTIDLIGDGPKQDEMVRLAADLDLTGRVRFLGAQADVAPLLAKSQVFVLSTRSEAFPYSVLEAMRSGLPIVSSDVGGIREAVTQDETGILVPSKDPAALSSALRRLITNPRLRTAMGSAGRRRFLDCFTIAKMVDRTLQVYRNVMPGALLEETRERPARDNRRMEVAGVRK